MPADDLVITGLGLVTPLGVGVEATWQAMLAGRYITDTGRVTEARDVTRSRVAQLGLMAAREAIGSRADALADASLIVGTSKGPVDEWLNDAAQTDRDARGATGAHVRRPSARAANATATIDAVSTRLDQAAIDAAFGLSGLADELASGLPVRSTHARLTLSAACASGLHALTRAALLLQAGDARAAIVVATESSLDPLWHGTFRRLGVLAPPGEPCRPLDESRSGFLISEAAAAIVLERRPARSGEIVIDRCAIASDATHLTGIDPTGHTLRSLIRQVAADAPIDFVHAHATATGNDEVELNAIRDTLGEGPAIYSHKGAVGHTLGASSLCAVVMNVLAHRTQTRPPMPTTPRPLPAVGSPVPQGMHRSLCLAAGFGGALAAASLRQVE